MEQKNELQKTTAKSLFEREDVKRKFQELLGKKATSFITSVLQIVSQNALLVNADPASIYQAAAMAATLDLPINNNLGFAYIIPYNERDRITNQFKAVAQFQLGYKGFLQLALRSGQFKNISVTPIYDGQLLSQDPLKGFEFDFTVQQSDSKPIGYAAYFSLLNGFEKTLYMSKEQVEKHGLKFSQTFKKGFGLWKEDFDSMAQKTVLKLLLSKYAPLSVEMQKAVVSDQAVINNFETEDISYVDNIEITEAPNKEFDRIALLINDAESVKDLKKIESHVPDELTDLFNQKIVDLGGK